MKTMAKESAFAMRRQKIQPKLPRGSSNLRRKRGKAVVKRQGKRARQHTLNRWLFRKYERSPGKPQTTTVGRQLRGRAPFYFSALLPLHSVRLVSTSSYDLPVVLCAIPRGGRARGFRRSGGGGQGTGRAKACPGMPARGLRPRRGKTWMQNRNGK